MVAFGRTNLTRADGRHVPNLMADNAIALCANDSLFGVDTFSLIMTAFGAFIKILEPISRMKRRKDQHQKTVIILIIVISAIPPLVGFVIFNFG